MKQPNDEQLAAVRAFKEKHGHDWKVDLLNAWLTGKDASEPNGHLLRQVRNQFGPTWLSKCWINE